MSTILQLEVTADGRTRSFTFDSFPVRIGRDESNDCELAFPFVSRLHATIELRGGALVLCDEGSRNGVYVRGARLERNECVDLGAVGFEFEIMTVRIRATLRQVPDTATVIDAVPDAANATHHYADERINPKIVDTHAIVTQVRAAYERYRDGWEEILRTLSDSVETLPPERRAATVQHLAIEFPQLAREAEFRSLATRYRIELGDGDRVTPLPTDADIALRGVRELAASYVPYAPPLASREAVAAFLEKVEAALDVLLQGFIALCIAHRYETKKPDAPISSDELAARLLDWTTDGNVARDDVESAFVEMLKYHARLVADLGAGAQTLLAELDPAAIEAAVPPTFLSIGRCRRLWKALRYRYARLTSEDAPLSRGTLALTSVARAANEDVETAVPLLPGAASA